MREYSFIQPESLAQIRAAIAEIQNFFQGIVFLAHPVYAHCLFTPLKCGQFTVECAKILFDNPWRRRSVNDVPAATSTSNGTPEHNGNAYICIVQGVIYRDSCGCCCSSHCPAHTGHRLYGPVVIWSACILPADSLPSNRFCCISTRSIYPVSSITRRLWPGCRGTKAVYYTMQAYRARSVIQTSGTVQQKAVRPIAWEKDHI